MTQAATSNNNIPANYRDMIDGLSRNAKLDLIVMLTQSLRQQNDEKKISAKDFYGIWGDDGYSDEDFVSEIRSARTFKNDEINL